MKRVHLDHNATTPLRPEARAELMRSLDDLGGNPSSVHAAGRAARAELDEARERVAAALGVDGDEIIFTSGGTEANNAALFGALPPGAALLFSAAEHSSVRAAGESLDSAGRTVRLVAVDPEGRLDLSSLADALSEGPAGLLSSVGANNELGTVAPFAEIRAALASGSTATRRTARPAESKDSPAARTEECSAALKRSAPPGGSAPKSAALFASVPPEVKMISSPSTPRAAATRSRASSSSARAARPEAWTLEGLPPRSSSARMSSARASGLKGVVALWSR